MDPPEEVKTTFRTPPRRAASRRFIVPATLRRTSSSGSVEIHSCDDVLSHVFEFLDHETDDERRAVIAEHLDDCSSCLRQFGIEQEVKLLVARRCGGERAPEALRVSVLTRLRTARIEWGASEFQAE